MGRLAIGAPAHLPNYRQALAAGGHVGEVLAQVEERPQEPGFDVEVVSVENRLVALGLGRHRPRRRPPRERQCQRADPAVEIRQRRVEVRGCVNPAVVAQVFRPHAVAVIAITGQNRTFAGARLARVSKAERGDQLGAMFKGFRIGPDRVAKQNRRAGAISATISSRATLFALGDLVTTLVRGKRSIIRKRRNSAVVRSRVASRISSTSDVPIFLGLRTLRPRCQRHQPRLSRSRSVCGLPGRHRVTWYGRGTSASR